MLAMHVAVANAQREMDTIEQLKEQAKGADWVGDLYRMTIECHQDAMARFIAQAFNAEQ